MEKIMKLDASKKLNTEELIPCYATDFHKYLRPTAFMDYAQELAYQGATALGFGYDVLIKDNMAWVLSRFHIKFQSPVKWGDYVKLQTWSKGPNGLYFLRDFMLRDPQGNEAVVATSSWIVLDLGNRSLVRVDRLGSSFLPEDTTCHDNAIEAPAPKIIMPRGVEPEKVGTHVVNYSDIDCLGHTNNVRYVVWSMDAVGPEITFKRPCKELFINFNKETHLGESVDIYRHIAQAEDGTVSVTIEGRVDGSQSFICKLIF